MEEKNRGVSQAELVKEDPAQTDPPTQIILEELPVVDPEEDNTKKK